jgi:hypothetical protein
MWVGYGRDRFRRYRLLYPVEHAMAESPGSNPDDHTRVNFIRPDGPVKIWPVGHAA